MGWLDKVPEAGELYIGGLYALRRRQAMAEIGITHIVSVLRWPLEDDLVKSFKHLQVDVDDDEDENLLESFPATNRFIEEAIEEGGKVFVHCAMGKSRSATVVIAYMMSKFKLDPKAALDQLRESRGVCEPNEGFMKQLWLYHSMKMPSNVNEDPVYQRWLYKRDLDFARAAGQAPDADKIRFEDEHASASARGEFELKCRKCRRTLATSDYLIEHKPMQKPGAKSILPIPSSACSHYFLEALSWMRPILEQGLTEGRLECPKCSTNVGKYAWQGMRCSCCDWIIPGISLAKGRVDEVKVKATGSADATGVRMPPRSNLQGNL